MIYMYIYLLLINSIVMFIMSLLFMYMKYSILLKWSVMSINSIMMEFILYFDWISLIFISLVSFISSFILFYSIYYLMGDMHLNRFFYLIILFVLSMILMILSPNIMSILLGWDGLGLVSYGLIIYYQNWKSFNSGMITVLMNRIGDVGILMMIGLLFIKGSWNLLLYFYGNSLLAYMLLLSACTKSAQLPFSVWLPLAMAAPTPVSSLVHSSTLVTAGVYLIMRFNMFIYMNNKELLLMISSLTMFMAGFIANFENDLKKIIALSTLSQLGLMMSILSLGEVELGFFHLCMHALFKSLLFMCSGMIIHLMMNNQDIRCMGSLVLYYPLTSIIFFFSSLSLCGYPFLSGFYSKDLIMEFLISNKMNSLSLIFIYLATMFTVSYSIRLLIWVYLGSLNKLNTVMIHEEDKMMIVSMVVLFIMSISGGYMFMTLFFYVEKLIILKSLEKNFIFLISFMGGFMGYCFYKLKLNNMSNMFKIYISKMFGLELFFNFFYFFINKKLFYLYKNLDKGVIDFVFVKMFKDNIFKMIFNMFTINKVMFYNIIGLLVLMFFYLILIMCA